MPPPTLVATLVANPQKAALSDAAIQRIAQALPAFVSSRWLAPGVAADLFFEASDLEAARARLSALALSEAIDIIVQPVEGRAKKLLIADMDLSLIHI